ncbi:MAG: class I SAM-dependent methyltransferase [Alphaproteobacteria bacterium]
MSIKSANIGKINTEILPSYTGFLKQKDREFLERVYGQDFDVYTKALKQQGVQGKRVLDAGCGFGQWSVALSQYNEEIYSVDCSKDRIDFLNFSIEKFGLNNITTHVSFLEEFGNYENFFDHIFCYGSLYLCDNWKRSLQNLINSTKKGGIISVMLTGIGYYQNLWDHQKNRSQDFDPRTYAFQALINSVADNKIYSGLPTVINFSDLEQFVITLGCKAEKSNDKDMFYERFYNEFDCVYWVKITKC